jgi:ADP-heptose:LPS heptosyltransferase
MTKPMRVVLFQNGSIGDFLMAVYEGEQLYESGVATDVRIVVPRLGSFLQGFVQAYPYICVMEVSRRAPFTALKLLPLAFSRLIAVVPPTVGRHPVLLKSIAWMLTRMPGSRLVGFADRDVRLQSSYDLLLKYDTMAPFIETVHSLLAALGASPSSEAPRLMIEGDPDARSRISLPAVPYVFFHPRGSSEKRSFSAEDATTVSNAVLARPDLQVVLSGSAQERFWLEQVRAASREPARIHISAGMNAAQLTDLIRNATLYIGVDTGITHLACFLGARVLVAAHKGTANWLPYYHSGARIIYRLEEDAVAHEDQAYLAAHRDGRLKPFGNVSAEAITAAVGKML